MEVVTPEFSMIQQGAVPEGVGDYCVLYGFVYPSCVLYGFVHPNKWFYASQGLHANLGFSST